MFLTGFKIKGLTGLYGVHLATIAKLHCALYHISKFLTLLRQIYFRTAAWIRVSLTGSMERVCGLE